MEWISYCCLITASIGALLLVDTQAENSCTLEPKNSSTYRLQSCLMKDYDPAVRPPRNGSVVLWFEFKHLTLRDDTISMSGPLTVAWKDERLAYDGDFYGVQSTTVPTKRVWSPPLVMRMRSRQGYLLTDSPIISGSRRNLDEVYVTSDGAVTYFEVISLYGFCHDPDFSLYPFEVHNCSIYLTALDPGVEYEVLGASHPDEHYDEYYQIVQPLSTTSHPDITNTETVIEFNIVFRRHARMLIISLHIPVLAFLLFNFVSLWLPYNHLMRLPLPITAFCGSLYQIHATTKLLTDNSQSDLFDLVGDKPLHIVLLYRNVIFLSLMVLLENFFFSLLDTKRKILISALTQYSPTLAKARANVVHTSKTPQNEEDQNRENQEDEDEESGMFSGQRPPPRVPYPDYDVTSGDYAITICDILIVTFIAYNFGYLLYLVWHC